VSLASVFWLVIIVTVLLILAGCPRRQAPVYIAALLGLLAITGAIG
jgi:hypothetical protein